ncbi:hypothetical protein SRB17_54350 [Streptomyces sp. RB17]|uniref:hypothetical protein n=1 Tax=Streptomyces sp. RB17 TaxID=2585197 RepID=UPI001298089E|nr:hypothetical protein [Streptomyces sp. RB17]MQY37431.1 hypothetical protein [Streptomyces sp. RB17]
MKRVLTRVRVPVVAAAIAGAALLGGTGQAFAQPVAHGQVAGAVPEKARDLASFAGRQVRGHEGERVDGWDVRDGRDGRRLYVWHEGRWIDVTPVREVAGANRWYLDQLRDAAAADRWYADQLDQAAADRWYVDQLDQAAAANRWYVDQVVLAGSATDGAV